MKRRADTTCPIAELFVESLIPGFRSAAAKAAPVGADELLRPGSRRRILTHLPVLAEMLERVSLPTDLSRIHSFLDGTHPVWKRRRSSPVGMVHGDLLAAQVLVGMRTGRPLVLGAAAPPGEPGFRSGGRSGLCMQPTRKRIRCSRHWIS